MHRPVKETVAILGATDDPYRYAHKTMLALADHGHTVLPVNPNHDQIDGIRCYPDLAACPEGIDTITVYVRPGILEGMLEAIVDARPGRVILNPGTEDRDIISRLSERGVKVQQSCTFVLLNTNRYLISR